MLLITFGNYDFSSILPKFALSIILIIVGFLLAHGFSTFEGLRDSGYSQLPGLTDAIIEDRKSMLLIDVLRSLALMLISSLNFIPTLTYDSFKNGA